MEMMDNLEDLFKELQEKELPVKVAKIMCAIYEDLEAKRIGRASVSK